MLQRLDIWEMFPTMISVDRRDCIGRMGRVAAKLLKSAAPGDPLADHVTALRPKALSLTYDGFRTASFESVLLRLGESVEMLAQITLDEATDEIVLVGACWLESPEVMNRAGLTFRDFAAWDRTLDYLLLLDRIKRQSAEAQASAVALEQARIRTSALTEALDREHAATMKYEELSQMQHNILHAVSHELRTPIGCILGHADLLEMNLAEDPAWRRIERSVQAVKESASRLLQTVTTITNVAKLLSGEARLVIARVDMAVLAREAAAELADCANHVQTRIEIREGHSPTLYGDRDRLYLCVRALLDNAYRFSTSGEVAIRIGASEDGAHLDFEVSDEGPGIPFHILEQIGRPFVQGDMGLNREQEGLGLGLTLVTQIVSAHQGELRLSRRSDRGSRAVMHLPIRRLAGKAEPAGVVATAISSRGK